MKKIQKIFIANRGEIAQRIMATAKKMGLELVVPVSELDSKLDYLSYVSQFVKVSSNLKDSFLNAKKMVELALTSGADAIHPGYGFLSENSEFARLCSDAGLTWIGPSSDLIQKMGNKQEAIETAALLGIPTLNGRFGKPEELKKKLKASDLPLIIKASNGGGGKGIHIISEFSEWDQTIEKAKREAESLFGSDEIFVEKYIPKARHIEVQVMGDKHGNVIHLYSRECSVQRRFQKLIEEAPAPGLSEEIQLNLYNAALKICHYISYENAGTVEFIVDGNDFYFLEMNTRIQVEHPVTEEVTGLDLIELQIRLASGQKLPFAQDEIQIKGHAIESRIYAEDPQNNFFPSPGKINFLSYPKGKGIRVETAVREKQMLPTSYDPLIAKIISYGPNRAKAIDLHIKALYETTIDGIADTIDFLAQIVGSNEFISQQFYTKLLDEKMLVFLNHMDIENEERKQIFSGLYQYLLLKRRLKKNETNVWNEIGFWRAMSVFTIYVNNSSYQLEVIDIGEGFIQCKLESGVVMHLENIQVNETKIKFLFGQKMYVFTLSEKKEKKILKAYIGDLKLTAGSFNSRRDEAILKDFPRIKGCVEIKASLPGKVIKLNVEEGKRVKQGEQLLVFESMKIENSITASNDGIISDLNICEGQQLNQNEVLLTIKDN